ncbi:MAG: cytochrome c peroxidase [Bacteroidota bacterium]|nr:cytochrome c peroxidase [Bacteroidota bacterium]
MNSIYKLIALGLFLLIIACQKSNTDPAPATTIYNPTSYNLTIPSHLGNNYVIPDSNKLTVEGVKLGRKLFYDKRLSKDNTISCGSCHKQQFAFTDDNQLSKGVGGKLGLRNSMSLTNLIWQKSLFWDGRVVGLEEQVMHPIRDTLEMAMSIPQLCDKLQGISEYPALFKGAFGSDRITPPLIMKAIAQFERTLISSNSKYDRYLTNGSKEFSKKELLGFILFNTHPVPEQNIRGGNCGDCHGGNLQQSLDFENNGLDAIFKDVGRGRVTRNMSDNGKFKVPSLRNIALTAPYMHDGRFKTLEEVLDHYNEHVVSSNTLSPLIAVASNIDGSAPKLGLTKDEKLAILAFLHTLTDSTFIMNPEFSDPNK